MGGDDGVGVEVGVEAFFGGGGLADAGEGGAVFAALEGAGHFWGGVGLGWGCGVRDWFCDGCSERWDVFDLRSGFFCGFVRIAW